MDPWTLNTKPELANIIETWYLYAKMDLCCKNNLNNFIFFSQKLKSEVNDTAPPELISKEEGLMMIDEADDVKNARLSNQVTLEDGGGFLK